MNIDAYFNRIRIQSNISNNIEGLCALVKAQSLSIPFENFDLMLKRPTLLDPDLVFDKLVNGNRGGCCFELNGLLLSALSSLDFSARALLARVHWRGDPSPRTHMLLLVEFDEGPWLADVGFGGPGLLEPIPFVCDKNLLQGNLMFRLVRDDRYDYMLQTQFDDGWRNLYSFDLCYVGDIDIEMGNFFVSNHPNSFFTSSRVATIPTLHGRKNLLNFEIKTKTNDGETILQLADDDSYLQALKEHFGIVLDANYADLIPIAT